MTAIFSKIVSFFMAAIAFLFPWIQIDKTNADLIVKLDSNASTGYDWSYEIEDDSIIVLTGKSYKDNALTGLVGAGGTQYFYFDALNTGTTDITFVCSQQWEGGAVSDTVIYTVTVAGDMSVSYVIN